MNQRDKCIKDGEYVEDFKTTDLSVFFQLFVSKAYERCLYVYYFFENKCSRYQCGFRKGFNTQNALLSMIEKMLVVRDKKEVYGGHFD